MVKKLSKKIYTCYVCGKVVDKNTITRFIKQLYGYDKYNQFADVRRFDFCEKCYGTIKKGIEKYKTQKQKGI